DTGGPGMQTGHVAAFDDLPAARAYRIGQGPDELRWVEVALSVDLDGGAHPFGQRRFQGSGPPTGDRVEQDVLPGVADLRELGQQPPGVTFPVEACEERARLDGGRCHAAGGQHVERLEGPLVEAG